jgi:hypothetical protein
LFLHEAVAELDAGVMKEPAGFESSVGSAERLCQEASDLLAKVRLTLDCVRDVSIPDSTSNTMAGILEALVVKADGEDPLVVAVRQQVTIGSKSVFSMLMMHGVEFDADKVTGTYRRTRTNATLLRKAILSTPATCLLG